MVEKDLPKFIKSVTEYLLFHPVSISKTFPPLGYHSHLYFTATHKSALYVDLIERPYLFNAKMKLYNQKQLY